MILGLGERLLALGLLANIKEGSYTTLKVVRDAQNALAPSEDEHKDFSIEQDASMVKWNAKGNEGKDIEMGDVAKSIIKNELIKQDKEGKLNQQLFSLYEKFVLAE